MNAPFSSLTNELRIWADNSPKDFFMKIVLIKAFLKMKLCLEPSELDKWEVPLPNEEGMFTKCPNEVETIMPKGIKKLLSNKS